MIYIGIDDTDSKEGMCTTYLGTLLISRLQEEGFDLIGHPRLVRLNPNIPWKTRGNGAICLRVGWGSGKRFWVGGDRYAYAASNGNGNVDGAVEIVQELVERWSRFEDASTNPGFVVFELESRPPKEFYWEALRSIVSLDGIKSWLNEQGAWYRGYKNGRGLIGAAAAAAWEPGDRTYELIAYRSPEKWGSKRSIDEASVIRMDSVCRGTFDNYDYEEKMARIAPNSPCPVLYGIRGEGAEDVAPAHRMVRGERADRWLVWETNQATDDHLFHVDGDVHPYESVMVDGIVSRAPRTIPGGHVIFTLSADFGEMIDCAAYEPTKGFRDVVRALVEGDLVTVAGAIRPFPLTINIEKIHVRQVTGRWVKVANPRCPQCGKRMGSMGQGKGYRCKRCGGRAGEERAERILVSGPPLGWYEVPVRARRHLSKPLKRMGLMLSQGQGS